MVSHRTALSCRHCGGIDFLVVSVEILIYHGAKHGETSLCGHSSFWCLWPRCYWPDGWPETAIDQPKHGCGSHLLSAPLDHWRSTYWATIPPAHLMARSASF